MYISLKRGEKFKSISYNIMKIFRILMPLWPDVRGHEEILHASIAVIKPIKHFHIVGFANNNIRIFNLF